MKAEDLQGPLGKLLRLITQPEPGIDAWNNSLRESVLEVLPMLVQVHYGPQQLHITGNHRYAFKSGESARIIGATMVTPEGREARACFEIQFPDGETDYVPLCDLNNYRLHSDSKPI